jgi:hypothetical protein
MKGCGGGVLWCLQVSYQVLVVGQPASQADQSAIFGSRRVVGLQGNDEMKRSPLQEIPWL